MSAETVRSWSSAELYDVLVQKFSDNMKDDPKEKFTGLTGKILLDSSVDSLCEIGITRGLAYILFYDLVVVLKGLYGVFTILSLISV